MSTKFEGVQETWLEGGAKQYPCCIFLKVVQIVIGAQNMLI